MESPPSEREGRWAHSPLLSPSFFQPPPLSCAFLRAKIVLVQHPQMIFFSSDLDLIPWRGQSASSQPTPSRKLRPRFLGFAGAPLCPRAGSHSSSRPASQDSSFCLPPKRLPGLRTAPSIFPGTRIVHPRRNRFCLKVGRSGVRSPFSGSPLHLHFHLRLFADSFPDRSKFMRGPFPKDGSRW